MPLYSYLKDLSHIYLIKTLNIQLGNKLMDEETQIKINTVNSK